jgi:Clr5-like protein
MGDCFGPPAISLPVAPGPSRPLSAEDWEEQRATFEQLYFREDRELREVMGIMKQDHGFLATYVLL